MLVKTEEAYKELQGFQYNSDCFYCGEIVSPPAIVWSGVTTFIQFHLDCAATFQVVFARDLAEFKQSSGKPLIFGMSHEEMEQIKKELVLPYDDTFPQYNVELTVPRFHFIDGGSEKVHIQDEKWTYTRCGHYFKQVRVIKERALDSDVVCRHCIQQGGVKHYPTGKRIRWDDTTRIVVEVAKGEIA